MTMMALARCARSCSVRRIVAAALISTSSGNLADLSFGMPDLLTRVRAAVFPVPRGPCGAVRPSPSAPAGWPPTSCRRHPLAVVRLGRRPGAGPLRRRHDRRTPVDVIAEFYPALAGLDETAPSRRCARVPTLVLTGDKDKLIPKAHSDP